MLKIYFSFLNSYPDLMTIVDEPWVWEHGNPQSGYSSHASGYVFSLFLVSFPKNITAKTGMNRAASHQIIECELINFYIYRKILRTFA